MMTPVYWMHEQSGMMKSVVMKFINNEDLTDEELKTMHWYIHQWADAMPQKPDDLQKIFEMSQEELKDYNFRILLCEYGIDAL